MSVKQMHAAFHAVEGLPLHNLSGCCLQARLVEA